jgi:hypothetical protein
MSDDQFTERTEGETTCFWNGWQKGAEHQRGITMLAVASALNLDRAAVARIETALPAIKLHAGIEPLDVDVSDPAGGGAVAQPDKLVRIVQDSFARAGTAPAPQRAAAADDGWDEAAAKVNAQFGVKTPTRDGGSAAAWDRVLARKYGR